jgi:hypothetical protein
MNIKRLEVVNVCFNCPSCQEPVRIDAPFPAGWRCPRCEHLRPIDGDADPTVAGCAFCGNRELYKKKDFPHGLGLAILTLACLASTVAYLYYQQWWTWGILIGSALFDGLLYMWVKDVVVCYRCDAHYRATAPNPEHKPFELTTYERYRQEQMRRKQLL